MNERLPQIDLEKWRLKVGRINPVHSAGQVTRVIGLTVEVKGILASIGEVCDIAVPGESRPVKSEVVGFRDDATLLMPLGELKGIHPGCSVSPSGRALTVNVGACLKGSILDGLGQPMDGRRFEPGEVVETPVDRPPPHPLARRRIKQVFATGVKTVDGLITCGKGQRIGIFSGSGVGKSTLLGMIARYGSADVNVIALVGERGREVREFIEKDLGDEGLSRSILVVATSDQPALMRLKAAFVASAISEYFRDQGQDVMLMMDSITRFAMAQREVGLAVGEPPATKGYTPSVFALLPRLLERSGMGSSGSITAFYTVLVEADDMNEPVADTSRGILDGHIVLSRDLAARNHYPAIDVLDSVSRLMPDIVTADQQAQAGKIKERLSVYRHAEDLINIGAYVKGSNPKIDDALKSIDRINEFLKQDLHEHFEYEETIKDLAEIAT